MLKLIKRRNSQWNDRVESWGWILGCSIPIVYKKYTCAAVNFVRVCKKHMIAYANELLSTTKELRKDNISVHHFHGSGSIGRHNSKSQLD